MNNEWIDAKAHEPNENEEVIILIEGRFTGTAVATYFDGDEKITYVNDAYDHFYSDDVTHFMRLPNPPTQL